MHTLWKLCGYLPERMHSAEFQIDDKHNYIMKNSIDISLCKNCRLCTEVCPCNIIEHNGTIHFAPEKEHICQHCGQCMAICPTKAIGIKGLSYENDFSDIPSDRLDYNGFMDFLSTRRSIRTFKDQAVDDEIMDQIADSVSYAPYGASPEMMELSIINNRNIIESALPIISRFLDDLVQKIENPVASFFIRRVAGKEDFHTVKNHIYPIAKSGNYKPGKRDGITRGAPSIIIIHSAADAEAHTSNGLVYATYIMLAAHSFGLGATMVQIVPAAINQSKKLKEIFKVPEENEAIMSVIIGHPKHRYQRIIKRKTHTIHKVQ